MTGPVKPRTTLDNYPTNQPLIGESKAIQAIKAYIVKVAQTDSNVLITGETGTGKELVAEHIHHRSLRSQQPFICINCAALADNLLESELFGYERGAFTGAFAQMRGKFELANGGTLFLDEIGDMSLQAQAKLLRAVEGKAFLRLGGQRSIPLNTRIIAATNQDLERLVTMGQFRNDLYFRLNVARIHLPPLRDRKQDLMALCEHYLQDFNRRLGRTVKGFTADAFECLLRYEWPGNVRELRHLLEAIFITIDGQAISYLDLPKPFLKRIREAKGLPLTERDLLLSTLFATNWNKSRAALKLNLSRMTLYRKLAKYQITLPRRSQARNLSQQWPEHLTWTVPSRIPKRRAAIHSNAQIEPVAWELPESLWRRMQILIPAPKGQKGRHRTVDLKRITEGIFYVLHTGIPWQACPRGYFGPPSTIYYYFVQWVKAGVFDRLWAEAQGSVEAQGIVSNLQISEWAWRHKNRAVIPVLGGGIGDLAGVDNY